MNEKVVFYFQKFLHIAELTWFVVYRLYFVLFDRALLKLLYQHELISLDT